MKFDYYTFFYEDIKEYAKSCNISEEHLKDFYNAFLKDFKYKTDSETGLKTFVNEEKNKIYYNSKKGSYCSNSKVLTDGDATINFYPDNYKNPILVFNYIRGNDYISVIFAPAKHKRIGEVEKNKQFIYRVYSNVVPYLNENYPGKVNIENIENFISGESLVEDFKLVFNSMQYTTIYLDGIFYSRGLSAALKCDYFNICSDVTKAAEQYYLDFKKDKDEKEDGDPQL